MNNQEVGFINYVPLLLALFSPRWQSLLAFLLAVFAGNFWNPKKKPWMLPFSAQPTSQYFNRTVYQ
jgi:hypothetical protein